jgi:VanZ family protein
VGSIPTASTNMTGTPSQEGAYDGLRRVRQTRLARPLIATIVYASVLTAVLVVPMTAPHIRRGYLREFSSRSLRHAITDIAANVAMFMPLGWGLHRVIRRLRLFKEPANLIVVTAAVAFFSLVMETVQYFLPTRYSSAIDVAADAVGAGLGAWLERRVSRDDL